mmetsp:Transcript_17618/g.55608  ORF Transcript_17618/g.55608 Transcript_17618/m.55608 type:complete len:82 (-) Transcript_17618:1820-2065(-)
MSALVPKLPSARLAAVQSDREGHNPAAAVSDNHADNPPAAAVFSDSSGARLTTCGHVRVRAAVRIRGRRSRAEPKSDPGPS